MRAIVSLFRSLTLAEITGQAKPTLTRRGKLVDSARMTWAERLLRLTGGGRTSEIVAQLQAMHQRSSAQEQRLAAAAAQAPTAGAEHELGALAAAREQLTAALAGALAERGGTPDAGGPPPVLNGAARNHWARLVAALEAGRQARAHLALTQPSLVELDPALEGLLQSVDRGSHRESLALRALIARADPQALN
jgi:hypothetical protein